MTYKNATNGSPDSRREEGKPTSRPSKGWRNQKTTMKKPPRRKKLSLLDNYFESAISGLKKINKAYQWIVEQVIFAGLILIIALVLILATPFVLIDELTK